MVFTFIIMEILLLYGVPDRVADAAGWKAPRG